VKPKGSRAKGARGENELNEILARYFKLSDFDFHRMRGRDCVKSKAAFKLFPFHVEVKYRERLNLEKAFEQSIEDADKYKDGEPVVIHRKNRSKWKITLDLEKFLQMFYPQGKDDE
jgi:hypothetical protein